MSASTPQRKLQDDDDPPFWRDMDLGEVVDASPVVAEATHETAAIQSPAHALIEAASTAFEPVAPRYEERWPPGAAVLLVTGVCGAFWAAVIAAIAFRAV